MSGAALSFEMIAKIIAVMFQTNECAGPISEVYYNCLLYTSRGTFTVVGVKAPGYGDRRKEMLKDIAILTGGTVISEELGLDLKDTTMDQLGRAKSVKVQKENTIIVDGLGEKNEISDRIAQIKAQIEDVYKRQDENCGWGLQCGGGRNAGNFPD